MSRLASSNFHIGIAERIGEADRVQALDRDRNALKKNKCCLSVFEEMRWPGAEMKPAYTVLIYRTKGLEGNWIEMVIAGYFGVHFFLAFGRRFSCRGCASGRYA